MTVPDVAFYDEMQDRRLEYESDVKEAAEEILRTIAGNKIFCANCLVQLAASYEDGEIYVTPCPCAATKEKERE